MVNYLQLSVFITTIVISTSTFLLSKGLVERYAKDRKMYSYMFWGAGIWLFGFTTLLEAMFAINIYSTLLADMYLFLVILLVELLALGSIQLVKNAGYRKAYYAFATAVSLIALFYIATANQPYLIVNYVVAAPLAINVALWSSVATFAASIVIVAVALKGYLYGHSRKLLSIIAGVIVVAVFGTLYIAALPEFLYFAEFAGMVLLWIGFR
jgi:hypothetical protein